MRFASTFVYPRAITRARDSIRWDPPPHGWVKLNCDGARSDGDVRAACGGIVRDHTDSYCFAFSCNLGECAVLVAELWAILYGVCLAWARGFRSISIESDSLLAITLLNKGCPICHPCHALVNQIKHTIGRAHDIRFSHVLREANQAADILAKTGLSLDVKFYIFESMPPFLALPCLADSSGVPFPRGF